MRFSTISLLALLPLVASHFTLDYPTSRGFDEDIEDQAPCGGFNNVSSQRSQWNYQDGKVQIDSHHDTATLNIYIAFSENPSNLTLADFTASSSANQLQNGLKIVGQGEFCFKNNITASNSSVSAGQQATIMVEHTSIHGHLYQCSDVILSNDTSLGSDITCTNALTVAGSNSPSSNSTGSSHTDAAQGLFVGITGVSIMAIGSVAALLL